ncbi:hypothetical protein EBR57_05460 [bacterium]|nr:hypothetical protein [bacterium]
MQFACVAYIYFLWIANFGRSTRHSLRTSNLIERFNREIKRRSSVVRIFPNFDSCLRLVSAILIEFNDDCSTGRRLFST